MLGEVSINCDEVKCPVPLERLPAKTDLSFHSWSYNPEKEEWTPWDSLIEGGDIPADAQFRDIIIQTSDSVRYTWLLRDAVTHQKPSLFVGPTGTGKTAYILKYLNSLPLEKYAPPILVSFSARTTANTTQYMIDAKLDKRRKGRNTQRACCGEADQLQLRAGEAQGSRGPRAAVGKILH